MMKENKCYKCAELEICQGKNHDEDKINCKYYCPCPSKDPCIIVEKSEDWVRLINRNDLKVICGGHTLTPEEILSALNIDYRTIEI